jgi:asparagine synthase (glutamine-hydrolysing)
MWTWGFFSPQELIRYRGTPADEVPLAEAVAERLGARHTTVWVTRRDFRDEIVRLTSRMDQPTIDGVNSYFVSRAAAHTGLKVALSGLGGDELFAGYPSFRELPFLVRAASMIPGGATLGTGLRLLAFPFLSRVSSPKYASLLEYGGDWGGAWFLRRGLFMPWELPRFLDHDLVRTGLEELDLFGRLRSTIYALRTDRARVSALESSWYMRNQLLRDTDWASMSSSLEVRVPFVDWKFWRRVQPLVTAGHPIDKLALAAAGGENLPPELSRRPKTGFSIPVRDWLLAEAGRTSGERGLRGWARHVYETFVS